MTPGLSDLESFRSALAEFDRHAEDILHADFGTFDNTLQRLITFERENAFTQNLFVNKLKFLNYEAFMMETSRGRGTLSNLSRLNWPTPIDERVGFQTRFLTDLANGEFTLLDLLHDFYSQTGVPNHDLRVFQDQLLRSYLRDYRLLLTSLEPKPIPPSPKRLVPDFAWYSSESKRLNLAPRCPFANVHACPRYYDSLFLLGGAGSTKISEDEQKRLDALWKNSPLLPVSAEQAAGVFSSNGRVSDYHKFCPEVLFDRFGLFATNLSRYFDETDSERAAQRLQQENAAADDPRLTWSAITPQHFSQCPLYSVLLQDWPKMVKRVPAPLSPEDRYDVFISHASEDKEDFVRPLALLLTGLGLRVWYDEWTFTLGDSLRQRIDDGLFRANFGVVVLSRNFFAKKWPQAELDGLFALEMERPKMILPIWHQVTKEEVLAFSPMLAAKMAASSEKGIEEVAAQIYGVARPSDRTVTAESIAAKSRPTARRRLDFPLADLLHTISEIAPLLYKLDEPIADTDARIFLGALQDFFCGGNLLTSEIDKDLRFGVDNLLRVMSQLHEPEHHQTYLFGKFGAARNSFEAYRARIKIGFELEPIDVSQPLGVGMHRLHATFGGWLNEGKQFDEDDRSVVRLVVALLDYGRRQQGPQQPFPPINPAIHQSIRAMLTQLLARHLNLAVPDQLENILMADVKAYCVYAWEELEDFEYGQARKACRILLDWFLSRMPWKRTKRVRPGDLIV